MGVFDGKKALVTGGSGFVGSHLVEALLARGARVVVFDNLSTGQTPFLETARRDERFRYLRGDLVIGSPTELRRDLDDCDIVFHLAAKADLRHNAEEPSALFEQNVWGTLKLLNSMRKCGVKRIVLASSGAVYGQTNGVPTPEDYPFPVQNSMYGASKVAAEGLVTAYCNTFNMQGYIFRFTPMVGERYSHGHLFDFFKKLRSNPERLELMGSGQERKYCVYVKDAVAAVLLATERAQEAINIFNVAAEDFYTVSLAADWVAAQLGLRPNITTTGASWAGDNPDMHLSSDKIRALGWKPEVTARTGVMRTVKYLMDNPWLLVRES